MARQIPKFPEDVPLPRMSGRYPWDEWLDGGVWELTQGKDFPGRIVGFIQTLAGHAKRRGGRVRSAKLEDGKRIVIQFIPDEQGGERKE